MLSILRKLEIFLYDFKVYQNKMIGNAYFFKLLHWNKWGKNLPNVYYSIEVNVMHNEYVQNQIRFPFSFPFSWFWYFIMYWGNGGPLTFPLINFIFIYD